MKHHTSILARTNILRRPAGMLCMILALFMLATDLPAQKRKTSRRKKSRTAAVTKPQSAASIVPLDSLIGKAYAGTVGRTVVDFFGTRTTYGDVTQQIYIWHDSIAVINQRGGDTETYLFLPYTLRESTLTVGQFNYTTVQNGHALQLQKTMENNETRQGTLSRTDPSMMVNALFLYGKHLDGMTIQTDEDKANALTCLNIAAEHGNTDARQYLYGYYKKKAEGGDTDAIKRLLALETAAGNYAEAHKYCDMLISKEPQTPTWLCEKGGLYVKEGKLSDAKKLYKKIKKQHKEFFNTSTHPFMVRMRDGK